MLVAVICARNAIEAKQQIIQVLNKADYLEIRFDFFDTIDESEIKNLRNLCSVPVIFTLRKKSQGGNYQGDEKSRLKKILSLCQYHPDYVDLEFDIDSHFIQKIRDQYPKLKIILSYHNFEKTPDDLFCLLKSLKDKTHADIYKIATYANSTLDALRMIDLIKKSDEVAGMCMGEYGSSTRIVGPVFGNRLNYASLDKETKSAPGQLSIDELLSVYRYRQLNPDTKIYALLGDPVDKSAGHLLHNWAIDILEENAIYIKLQVVQKELPEVIALCRKLPIAGLSVTMPLKESVYLLCDVVDQDAQSIKAINSVVVKENQYIGFNTDGEGAMNALSSYINLEDKRLVILGAGGSARALAYSAIKRNAKVLMVNRTLSKALAIANELQCQALSFEKLSELKSIGYDILINTLPFDISIDEDIFIPESLVMDIVYHPRVTSFLQKALQSGCCTVTGDEMFIEQALLQIQRWFHPASEKMAEIRKRMKYFFYKMSG